LPARYEPFGLSVLEAGLARCALVLADIPSLREVWGDAASYVPADDHAGLRECLKKLIADDDLRARLADKARARALSFTPQRMARGYLAAYSSLLRAPRDARAASCNALESRACAS
jgi:glycosyltransferase involved in cell wall biosynthesis